MVHPPIEVHEDDVISGTVTQTRQKLNHRCGSQENVHGIVVHTITHES